MLVCDAVVVDFLFCIVVAVVMMVTIVQFLAALSSSRSAVVRPSVRRSVRPSTFMKK